MGTGGEGGILPAASEKEGESIRGKLLYSSWNSSCAGKRVRRKVLRLRAD